MNTLRGFTSTSVAMGALVLNGGAERIWLETHLQQSVNERMFSYFPKKLLSCESKPTTSSVFPIIVFRQYVFPRCDNRHVVLATVSTHYYFTLASILLGHLCNNVRRLCLQLQTEASNTHTPRSSLPVSLWIVTQMWLDFKKLNKSNSSTTNKAAVSLLCAPGLCTITVKQQKTTSLWLRYIQVLPGEWVWPVGKQMDRDRKEKTERQIVSGQV